MTTNQLLAAIDSAFADLTKDGCNVSGQQLADHIGVTLNTLKGRKAIYERLKTISAQQGWSDAELLTAMDNAFEALRQTSQHVPQQVIADHIGVTLNTLKRRKAITAK